jgi:hypothetical protein
MHANTSCAALDAAHLSPTARGVIATPANAAGTAAAPIVSLYDLDTSSYDIDPDGRTVHIYGAADWADARDQLEGRVPEETLDDFERFYLENKISWAQVQ